MLSAEAAQAVQAPAQPLDLASLRQRIDELDRELVDILNQRAACAAAMPGLKRQAGQGAFAPAREAMLLRALTESNNGPLSAQALTRIMREVISSCRDLQAPLAVAVLGPQGTFSHAAALARFGGAAQVVCTGSIGEVFDAVARGKVDTGLAPVENSSEGGVNETLDRLLGSSLMVCGETFHRISHALLSTEARLEDIAVVYSHPQALAQCRAWLQQNLPHARLEAEHSTAQAARRAAGEPGAAAVASQLTAELHGLGALAADIQDNPNNITRFLVLGREACPPTGQDKTSLALVTAHKPGTLHRALECFARRGVNLTRIESRPTRERPWEYAFFLDCEGHCEDGPVREALEELNAYSATLRVLGSYPRGEEA